MTARRPTPRCFSAALLKASRKVEALGYRRLGRFGSVRRLTRVTTVGGGAANEVWRRSRETSLGCRSDYGRDGAAGRVAPARVARDRRVQHAFS